MRRWDRGQTQFTNTRSHSKQVQLSGVLWPQTFHPAAVSVEEPIYVCGEIFWEVTKDTMTWNESYRI